MALNPIAKKEYYSIGDVCDGCPGDADNDIDW